MPRSQPKERAAEHAAKCADDKTVTAPDERAGKRTHHAAGKNAGNRASPGIDDGQRNTAEEHSTASKHE